MNQPITKPEPTEIKKSEAEMLDESLKSAKPSVPLAYKVALSIGVLLSASLGILWLIITINVHQLLEKQAADYGYSLAKQAADSASEMILAEDNISLQVLINNIVQDSHILEAAIYAQDGTLLVQAPFNDEKPQEAPSKQTPSNKPPATQAGTTAPKDAFNPLTFTLSDQIPFVVQAKLQNVLVGFVKIVLDRTHLELALTQVQKKVSVATLFMIALSIAAAFFLGRRLSKPVDDLVIAAEKIAHDHNQRIDEKRNDELGNIINTLNHLADGVSENSVKVKSLSRLAPPAVVNKMHSQPDQSLPGEHVHATVMFVDMVGFTSLSEQMRPQAVADLLNRYFTMINRVAKLYNGVVDKYLGDGAMIIFGAPLEDEEHCFHALCCARVFTQLIKTHNDALPENAQKIKFRIGIHTGEMIAGAMGSADQMQYTVIGDSVNLASRLCAIGEPNEIIVSEKVLLHGDMKNRILVENFQEVLLKGKSSPTKSYRVIGLKGPYPQLIERQVQHLFKQLRDTAQP